MAIKGVIKNSVTADISAEQFASLFESVFGKNGICNVYEKLQCVKIDNNTVRLSSGVYNLSGYMVMVENGTNEDFVIDSGTAGLKRNDLLIAEFVRNGNGSGIDVLTFRIVKGTSVVGAATDPVLITQDISAEGTTRQEALYRVMIDGTEITSVVPVAGAIENMNALYPESGNNANGSWVKFPDGTLLQYSLTPTAILANQTFADITYPIPFVGGNAIIPSQRNINVNDAILSANAISTTTGRVYRSTAKSTQADFVYMAIGRWK